MSRLDRTNRCLRRLFRSSATNRVVVMPTAYGISGFVNTNLLRTAVSAGLTVPADTAFWVECVLQITTQAVSSASRYVAANFSGGAGWRLTTEGTNSSITFLMIDGAVTGKSATPFTVGAGMVGGSNLLHVYAYFDLTRVRMSVNRVLTGTGDAVTTNVATGATNTLIGQRAIGTNVFDNSGVIFGLRGGTGVKTQSDAESAFDAWRSASRLSGGTHCWDVGTSQSGSVPSPLPDLVGSDNMTFSAGSAGSHSLVTVTNPQYPT